MFLDKWNAVAWQHILIISPCVVSNSSFCQNWYTKAIQGKLICNLNREKRPAHLPQKGKHLFWRSQIGSFKIEDKPYVHYWEADKNVFPSRKRWEEERKTQIRIHFPPASEDRSCAKNWASKKKKGDGSSVSICWKIENCIIEGFLVVGVTKAKK